MRLAALSALLTLAPGIVLAQWTNRYPKLEGYSHHVYVEGFELPMVAAGPTDPAPSPDGATIAIAARGWLWLLDPATGVARRVTSGPELDSRPAWHPDGTRLAFLRDDSERLTIWSLDLGTGEETLLFEDDSIVLDPAWSPDGETLYFSASTAGDLDIWRLSLETGEPARVTERRGLEVRPQPLPDGGLAYLSKGRSSADAVIVRDASGAETSLRAESIASQARPGAARGQAVLAVNWPAGDGGDGYRLMLLDPEKVDPMELVAARGLPLTPAFTADGESVIYTEADDNEEFRLRKISTRGGPVTDVPIRGWDFGAPLARVRITTRKAGGDSPVPARLEVLDPAGHPTVVPGVFPRFDGTHGRIYFYSPGVVEVEVPASFGGGGADQRDARIQQSPRHGVGPRFPGRDGRGRSGLRAALGRAGRRIPLRRPPLPSQLRRRDAALARRSGTAAGGGGPGSRHPADGKPPPPAERHRVLPGPPGGRRAGRPVRPGDPVPFPGPPRADRHRERFLALVLGAGLPGVRSGRPPEPRRARRIRGAREG